jgi:hypothetical protein
MAVTPVDSRLTSIALQQQAGDAAGLQGPRDGFQRAEYKE